MWMMWCWWVGRLESLECNRCSRIFQRQTIGQGHQRGRSGGRRAALQSAILSRSMGAPQLTLLDVNAISLGIEVMGGKSSVLIPRNSTLPFKVSRSYQTQRPTDVYVHIMIFEGEGDMVVQIASWVNLKSTTWTTPPGLSWMSLLT